MIAVKLTRKMKSMYPDELLVALGAANLKTKTAYPQHVYLSAVDYKNLRKCMYRNERKLAGESLRPKHVRYAVEMYLLNLGPNEMLRLAIKPGFVLVDDDAIKNQSNK